MNMSTENPDEPDEFRSEIQVRLKDAVLKFRTPSVRTTSNSDRVTLPQ